MLFKNYNLFIFLIVLISINISLAKKNKNNDIKAPEIYELDINDHYPYYIEFTLVGQFSKDKTGFQLYYGNEKVDDYIFEKGEVIVENVTTSESSIDNTTSPTPSISNTPSNESSSTNTPTPSVTSTSQENNNTSSNTPTQGPQDSNSPSITSKPDKPTSAPKEKKDKKSKDDKKNSNKKLKTSHLLQKKNDKPSNKPSSNSLESSKDVTPSPTTQQPNTQSPSSPAPTTAPPATKSPSKDSSTASSLESSSKENTSTSPTESPSSTNLVKSNDKVSFNVTNFKSFKSVNITIRYKTDMEASVPFTFESIISSITRVNVTGGVVDIEGRFIFDQDKAKSNPPKVSIGNSVCESISFNNSLIRCYLSRGSGCDNIVSISNIQAFNSSKYQYCYSNPIIERVIIPSTSSSDNSKDKYITIIGQNFDKYPHVYLERSSNKYTQTRSCSNVLNGDTIIVCLLNSSFSYVEKKEINSTSKLLQVDKDQEKDEIHYSLFVLNVAENVTVEQAKLLLFYNSIVGEYDFNKEQQNSTITILEFNHENVEKDNHKSNNNNSNSKSEDAKFYLLIIIPSVLFIVIIVLIAVFVKTRAKGKDKIPFLVLNDIGGNNSGNNNNNDNQFNENLITPI